MDGWMDGGVSHDVREGRKEGNSLYNCTLVCCTAPVGRLHYSNTHRHLMLCSLVGGEERRRQFHLMLSQPRKEGRKEGRKEEMIKRWGVGV